MVRSRRARTFEVVVCKLQTARLYLETKDKNRTGNQMMVNQLRGTESYENVLSILCSGNPDSMMFIAYSSKPYYHGWD